jgi:hypothetical protein
VVHSYCSVVLFLCVVVLGVCFCLRWDMYVYSVS